MDRSRSYLLIGALSALLLLLGAALTVVWPRLQQQQAAFEVQPASVTLCAGRPQQFQIAGGPQTSDCRWTATGGQVGTQGFYVAPDVPGRYYVCAVCGRTPACAGVQVAACAPASPPPATAAVPPAGGTDSGTDSETGSENAHSPTRTPRPTRTAVAGAAPTSTPAVTSPAVAGATPAPTFSDPAGDFVYYESGQDAAGGPPGSDLAGVSLGPQGSLQTGQEGTLPADAPPEVRTWLSAGRVVLWMRLYDPIPDTPDAGRYWLFALDTDADPTTGRPPGSAPINPDMGPEAIVGLRSSEGGTLETYSMVWDAAAGRMAVRSLGLDYALNVRRDAVFLSLAWETLQTESLQLAGVEAARPERARGRAATLSGSGAEQIVDYAPDLPAVTGD